MQEKPKFESQPIFDWNKPGNQGMLDTIYSTLLGGKDTNKEKMSIITSLLSLNGCPSADYYAFIMVSQWVASKGKLTKVDVRRMLVTLEPEESPIDPNESVKTFSLNDFYDNHPEIAALNEEQTRLLLVKGGRLKEFYDTHRRTYVGTETPYLIYNIRIPIQEPADLLGMTWKRMMAAVGYHNIIKGFNILPSISANINYSKCSRQNQSIYMYAFSGSEWLVKEVIDQNIDIDPDLVGSIVAQVVLLDYCAYRNALRKKNITDILSLPDWMEGSDEDGAFYAMMRNLTGNLKLDDAQQENFNDNTRLYILVTDLHVF